MKRKSEGSLTDDEKSVVKALLERGWRNQDIQAHINLGRPATINSARITEVKYNGNISPCDDEMLEHFNKKKKLIDAKTGLNVYDDERLIRAREAMLLAVNVFNNPILHFKTEAFAVLANIAWTYLLHEYYERKGISVVDKNGETFSLSYISRRADAPLSSGIRKNLEAIKIIRDGVEHKLLRRSDENWLSLFQACCLNFDATITRLFGPETSLQNDLAVALHFAKLSTDQISTLNRYDIPEHIRALDARLNQGLTEDQLNDLEYQFRVVYTLDSASKSRAHMQFFHPSSEAAQEFRNVLIKYKNSDELYPLKPYNVVDMVKSRTGRRFTSHNHTQSWRKYGCRPKFRSKAPEKTNDKYCIYHPAHKDYTYSNEWVDFLVEQVSDPDEYRAILAVKL